MTGFHMHRSWLPLHPRHDDGCAIGARGSTRSRRCIERLLSPPIDPRLEVLKRGAARRAKCGVVRHDRRVAHGAQTLLLLFNTTRTLLLLFNTTRIRMVPGPPSTGFALSVCRKPQN